MGVYDIFGEEGAQLKAGPCEMRHYAVGNPCPEYQDGVYLAYEGAVVVVGGVFQGVLPMWDKWGGALDAAAIIRSENPVAQAIKEIRDEEAE